MDETITHNEELLLKKLEGLVKNLGWKPEDVIDLFSALLTRFSTTNNIAQRHTWMLTMLHNVEMNYVTPGWTCQTRKTVLQLIRDQTVTDKSLVQHLGDDSEKTLEGILQEISEQKLNQIDPITLKEVEKIVLSVEEKFPSSSGESQLNGLAKYLFKVCWAVQTTKHYKPRLTQMVSWCLMALSSSGRLIQVGTGEGKSCIVAMFAAFRAMKGENVDIMSSSTVLAERDMLDWKKFYKTLEISVSCNANKHDNNDLKKCYRSTVVYGTVESFAGDWLRHNFKRMDTFGQRKFQCAIVDEVDSLMLDKGLNVVYMSSNMPALQHLSPLLALIWATVNQQTEFGSTSEDAVVLAVEVEVRRLLLFTPSGLQQHENICYLPGFLRDLVNAKLTVWIENALRAQTMTAGHEYVIERHGLVPVDYSCTGVVENFMEWSDGLHQFLQMKHGIKLSNMDAITNYMSNVGLLQMYEDQIYGMSGTLGKQTETETLQNIYTGIKICQIPAFKRRKLFEIEGVIAYDEEEWMKTICSVVTEQINPSVYRDKRAVLVICETINRADAIYKALGDEAPNKRLYINNNMDNSSIFTEKLQAGQVIIATNLAGRGTDLQVSDQVKIAGGLFVVQTFLPTNTRVEEQAFGRTARQGFPGCAQLIVCSSHLAEVTQLVFALRALTAVIPSYIRNKEVKLFVMQYRLFQQSQEEEVFKAMALTLSGILTETSDSEMKLAKRVRDDAVTKRLASYLQSDIPKIKKKQSSSVIICQS
ncbi:protein translocase subunit SecA-like [Genypterus blacodes]|uniref:protein translocase subunit SecA-like n=1 Tax=Genypterus blacodes TaxID=154954 RepID=UPI003F7659BA